MNSSLFFILIGFISWAAPGAAQDVQVPGSALFLVFRSGSPVPEFQFKVDGKDLRTDENGAVSLEKMQGLYQVQLAEFEYQFEIKIQSGFETEVSINLDPHEKKASAETRNSEAPVSSSKMKIPESPQRKKIENLETEEFVVLSPHNKSSVAALIQVRRQSNNVSEVLGSEQMSKQGDSDAAASLRRVTGLTLMDGKYVYVRGLGDRYSAAQLNGFMLPSPEPARRVVPLDLFPSSILESVIVQKSFSPNQSGEFGGGMIQMKTKSIPDEFKAQISMGSEFGRRTDLKTYRGGNSDWTGHDDGARQMPSNIKNALQSGQKLVEKSPSNPNGLSREELKALGAELPKNYNLQDSQLQALPDLSFSLGNTWSSGNLRWGGSISLLNNTDLDRNDKKSAVADSPEPGQLVVTENANSDVSSIERKLGLISSLGLEYEKNHHFNYNFIQLRHASDEVSIKTSAGSGLNDFERRQTRTEWIERNLNLQQLYGDHQLLEQTNYPILLAWRLGQSTAERQAPDSKEYNYRKITSTDPYRLDPEVSGNLRTSSEMKDQSNEIGLDLSLKLKSIPLESVVLRSGISQIRRKRQSETYRLQYIKDYLSGSEPDLTQTPDQIFSENDKWILVNQTSSADSYDALQNIDAKYIAAEISPNKNWDLSVGLRQENSVQEVRTFYYYSPNEAQSLGSLKAVDALPSYSLVWKPSEEWRGRLAYSETVARPEFRELSGVRYIDDDTGYEARGNNELKGSIIQNIDQRWEYYFSPDEFISIGFFEKKFQNPIEDVFEPMAGSLMKVPQNALSARNQGVEFEGRLNLRQIHRGLRRWSLAGNYSLIDSKVEIDPKRAANLTTSDRPLQGQSPFVLNIQLMYDRAAQGTSATLLYNVIGRRITEVGTDSRPDIYEESAGQLDFVLTQKWSENRVSGNFKIKNILDPEIQATQGPIVVRSARKERTLALGVSLAL